MSAKYNTPSRDLSELKILCGYETGLSKKISPDGYFAHLPSLSAYILVGLSLLRESVQEMIQEYKCYGYFLILKDI